MQNIIELIDRDYLFESDQHYFEFLVRLYWLRCHLFLYRGQTNLAIAALNDVLACYELHSKFKNIVLPLKNCRKNNVISKAIAEEFLADQSRYLFIYLLIIFFIQTNIFILLIGREVWLKSCVYMRMNHIEN